MPNDHILPHSANVPLILTYTAFTVERNCRECFRRSLDTFHSFSHWPALPQVTLRLVGLVHLNPGDIDDGLAFRSYFESFRYQLGYLLKSSVFSS